MSNKKDPAFLFYSKDWIEGTAELMPDEKGVFIDLLCHQHQKGSIPDDTIRLSRMVGLPQDQFDRIWVALQPFFNRTVDQSVGRLVNSKLERITSDRKEKSHKNTIIGTFASILRHNQLSSHQYTEVKKIFDVSQFLQYPKEEVTERLTEWLQERLKSIGNGIGIGDKDKTTKVKRKRNLSIIPTKEEVILFFNEKGYKTESAEKFFNYYNIRDWKDSNNRKVKDWQQKARIVWFTPENEIPKPSKPNYDPNNTW